MNETEELFTGVIVGNQHEKGVHRVTEQMAEDTATTKRIETDRLERQMKEDKLETQRIEREKLKQPPLKKNG